MKKKKKRKKEKRNGGSNILLFDLLSDLFIKNPKRKLNYKQISKIRFLMKFLIILHQLKVLDA